ncbi:RNA polymerase sigma factor [Microbacterium sp. OVT16B]|uniref:RNA polymerase sigma factor n=1 Tax=Microbacterium sp. OVT16B TaxID=2862682 RepID=UPI001CBA91D7|nr:sigma-70 family RNA polymerase sigma factor [Microbacterium sp. OVT16B]
MEDPRSDAELLRELRDGERDAYVVLWERHIGAALRYARRMLPSRAEDLASESFLAIYQQITTSGTGPDFAFRSYLKAVIRNTAIRWRKEASRFDDTVEADAVDFRDALSLVERESNANELLGAFQELPERWQKVLWLSEVADVARPEIARELGIKPNAVSALHRRARSGLKLQWLTRQVPVVLREDETHAARLLPRHLSEPDDQLLAREITTHLESCDMCSDLLVSLRTDARRLQGVTLSAAGFGALGVALPATSALAPGTAVAASILLTGAGTGIASLLAGGVGVLAVGGILLGSFFLQPGDIDAPALADTNVQVPVTTPTPDGASLGQTGTTPTSTPVTTVPLPPRLGRWNSDPNVPLVDFRAEPVSQYVPPAPQPAGPEVPGPGTDPGGMPTLTPGLTSPPDVTAYLAPQITGRTTPGNSVAIEFASQRYEVDVAPDGSWTFDTRPLAFDAGAYDYAVWAFTPTEQSLATTGTITVQTPTVQGFEQIEGPIPLEEARTTGIVISLTGPPNGTIWASTPKTDATITLDGTGHATRRIRMLADGWYPFAFSVIDADWYSGPGITAPVDVVDPTRDPSWPRGGGGIFEVVDP